MKLEDVLRKISDGETTAPFCFLCRGIPTFTGAFIPKAGVARRLGQPEGKQRIIYGVCERCMENREKAEIMELMEQNLLRRHGTQ